MRQVSSLAAVISKRYWRVEDAERVLAALRESGSSVAAFAREHGVNEARLLRWRQRLRKMVTPRFHPVKVVRTSAVAESPIELVLVGGERLVLRTGFDPTMLRQIKQALEGSVC